MGRAHFPPILVVNADDFGISEGVNRAIVEGHREGIVTSASLLATGCAFEHAVELARGTPGLGVGVHLCLHSEKPVLSAERVASLTDAGGRLRGPNDIARALLTRSANLDEVRSELEAQVERVRDAGIAITHMDSHSHLHAFPGVGPIVRDLAARFGVRWVRRVAASPSEYVGAPLGRIGISVVLSSLGWLAHRHYGAPMCMPDRLLGLTRSGRVDEAWVCRMLARLRPGTVNELMVHPGDGSPETGDWRDHDAAARVREAALVRSPAVRDRVRSLGVRLASFRDLPSSE
jgi:hypothetical protein